MAAEKQKMIVVPVDGSKNSLRSLDYTNLMFGPKHNLKVTLFHVLPSLPAFLSEESRKDVGIGEELQNLNYLDLIVPEHRKRVQIHYMRQYVSKKPSSFIEYPFKRFM